MRFAGRFSGPKVVILMYHSVMDHPERELSTLGGIVHSTEIFREQMRMLAREYHPVTMNDVVCFVKGERELPSQAVVVTFDDGYADNYEVAMPILNEVGVPAIFYVTVDSVDRGSPPWPAGLRHSFSTTRKSEWVDSSGKKWAVSEDAERNHAFLHSCDECAKLSGDCQKQYLRLIETQLEVKPLNSSKNLMMNWDQTRGLLANGHLVGSHTMTHPNVAFVTDNEAKIELSQSKQRLEEVLGFPIVHFSYPCPALTPHWKQSTAELTRQIGYQTAVTTDGGAVRLHDDPLCLRRARPTKEVQGLRWNLEGGFLGRKNV